jgi:hypothetical protein
MSAFRCPCCGGTRFTQQRVLWDSLVEGWGLSPAEAQYIDEQQGYACDRCGCRLRSMVLARAIGEVLGFRGQFRFIGLRHPLLKVLEVNNAGDLTKFLRRFPRHQLRCYPDVDFHALPYATNSFALVVHSDTLEQVKDPANAIRENGADAWTQLMEAGFDNVRLFSLRFPAGLALAAQKH